MEQAIFGYTIIASDKLVSTAYRFPFIHFKYALQIFDTFLNVLNLFFDLFNFHDFCK